MPTRYVGPGGNDGNSGLTWALRKLTLNGVEDTPVVAGDVVWVGPGTYRELFTVDVSGGVGTEIEYIGDVTGENTDGVGGVVRITGSDNDITRARIRIISISAKSNRVFRGFRMDMASGQAILIGGVSINITIEDCVFTANKDGIALDNASHDNVVIRRCVFIAEQRHIVYFHGSADDVAVNTIIENCLFVGDAGDKHIWIARIAGGTIIRNCAFTGGTGAVQISIALHVNQSIAVENCILDSLFRALGATAVTEIIEDFNAFFNNAGDRVNTNVGANSNSYPALFAMPLLHSGVAQISGFEFPWWFGELSEWSPVGAITGADERTEELRGIARPVTASKNSWGPAQFFDMERETGTVRTGSVSMAIRDAGRHQIWVPVTATSTTIQVYVYREANYAGLLPQMIIKQPGQADDVTTDVGAAGGWNLLTTTLTPAADPPYVVVELVSRNTNGAADEVFFDDLDVS